MWKFYNDLTMTLDFSELILHKPLILAKSQQYKRLFKKNKTKS